MARRCSRQGPLQTLLTAEALLEALVDSCASLDHGLARLAGRGTGVLPLVVQAQARMLGPQLGAVPVSHRTLHRLHRTLCELKDEAERVRCTGADEGALRALIARLSAKCPQQLLANDAEWLRAQLDAAGEEGRLVHAAFLRLALGAAAEAAAAGSDASGGSRSGRSGPEAGESTPSTGGMTRRASSSNGPLGAPLPAAAATAAPPRAGSSGEPPLSNPCASVAQLVACLGSNSTSPAVRQAAVAELAGQLMAAPGAALQVWQGTSRDRAACERAGAHAAARAASQ